MDLTKGNIRNTYFKYLAAAFGSAMIASIYGLVDTAMVGQYSGPSGAAAMAVVAPVWNLVYSLGLLTGIGGSVLYSTEKGKKSGNENRFFTLAFFFTAAISIVFWALIFFCDEQLLSLFGADEEVMPYAVAYLAPIKCGIPLFMFSQFIAAFLRNDNDPQRATLAVLCGGVFNIAADYIFIFILDMGPFGGGLATTLGAAISVGVMCTHFLSKKNTLRFAMPRFLRRGLWKITITGFPSFFVDVAMGILTMLFNRQIVKYMGNDALAVYGIIANLVTAAQSCAYSVGQSAQPLYSVNLGAGKYDRVKQTLKYAIIASVFFCLAWTFVMEAFPNPIMNLFMDATDSVLAIAPAIVRVYCISFLLMPFNVAATYYFQALLKPTASFTVSILRGMVLSGILIYVLPALFPAEAIWWAMPITELVDAILVIVLMVKYTKELGRPLRKIPADVE